MGATSILETLAVIVTVRVISSVVSVAIRVVSVVCPLLGLLATPVTSPPAVVRHALQVDRRVAVLPQLVAVRVPVDAI